MPGQTGLGSAQASFGLKVKNSKTGSINAILLAGGLVNTTLWVHELGHSLFSFEDLYLFAFSVGMCSLLVAVGLSSGLVSRLPRAGAWMLWVKRGFAVIMIGVAEYYLIEMGKLLF